MVEVAVSAKTIDRDGPNGVLVYCRAVPLDEPEGNAVNQVERVRRVHGHLRSPRVVTSLPFTFLGNGLFVNDR
jgi:hypothetical protein